MIKTRKQLEDEATLLLAQDDRATSTRLAMRSVYERWRTTEEAIVADNQGRLPPASVLANDLYEAYSKWSRAMRRGTDEAAPTLFLSFVAHAAIFAKSYGEHVYLPMLVSGGVDDPDPEHDVDRPALRLVRTKKEVTT